MMEKIMQTPSAIESGIVRLKMPKGMGLTKERRSFMDKPINNKMNKLRMQKE